MDVLIYLLNAALRLWRVSVLPRLPQWAKNRLCTTVHFGHTWSGKRDMQDGMDHCRHELCTARTFISEAVIQNDGYSGLVQLVPGDFTIGPKWLNALVAYIELIWPPKPKDVAAQVEVVPAPRAELHDARDQAPAEAQHSYA